jgi:hypothetical protein
MLVDLNLPNLEQPNIIFDKESYITPHGLNDIPDQLEDEISNYGITEHNQDLSLENKIYSLIFDIKNGVAFDDMLKIDHTEDKPPMSLVLDDKWQFPNMILLTMVDYRKKLFPYIKIKYKGICDGKYLNNKIFNIDNDDSKMGPLSIKHYAYITDFIKSFDECDEVFINELFYNVNQKIYLYTE